MVLCPKCSQKLPDGVGYCQFCHATFPPIGTPAVDPYTPTNVGPASWIKPAYNAIAIWWIIDGAIGVIRYLFTANGVSAVGLIISLGTIAVGVGILMMIDAARGVLNFFCFLQLLSGGLQLLFGFFAPMLFGIWGVLYLILELIRVATAVLMIYLIGETETRGPNF